MSIGIDPADIVLAELAGFRLSWPGEQHETVPAGGPRRTGQRRARMARMLPVIGRKLAARATVSEEATGWAVSLSVPDEASLPTAPRTKLSGPAIG